VAHAAGDAAREVATEVSAAAAEGVRELDREIQHEIQAPSPAQSVSRLNSPPARLNSPLSRLNSATRGWWAANNSPSHGRTKGKLVVSHGDVETLHSSDHMLLYLNDLTWTRGDAVSDALASDIASAMDAGMHILLAHEMNGLGQQDNHPCDFGIFFSCESGTTPTELLRRGLYNEIAVALRGGAWRRVSMTLLGSAIAASTTQEGDVESSPQRIWLDHRGEAIAGGGLAHRLTATLRQGSMYFLGGDRSAGSEGSIFSGRNASRGARVGSNSPRSLETQLQSRRAKFAARFWRRSSEAGIEAGIATIPPGMEAPPADPTELPPSETGPNPLPGLTPAADLPGVAIEMMPAPAAAHALRGAVPPALTLPSNGSGESVGSLDADLEQQQLQQLQQQLADADLKLELSSMTPEASSASSAVESSSSAALRRANEARANNRKAPAAAPPYEHPSSSHDQPGTSYELPSTPTDDSPTSPQRRASNYAFI